MSESKHGSRNASESKDGQRETVNLKPQFGVCSKMIKPRSWFPTDQALA